MDKLIHLSNTIQEVWLDLSTGEAPSPIIQNFSSLINRPLICFNEAYSVFMSQVGSKSDLFDSWVSIQMMVITRLGEHQVAFSQFSQMFKEVFKTIEGGNGLDISDENEYKRWSFLIALAFRVYTSHFIVPPSKGRKA